MALKTNNIKNAQLVEVTDWKATGISIDYNEMKAQSIMSGYVSKEVMDNNAEPLDVDVQHAKIYWSQEDLNAEYPEQSKRLKELLEKQSLTDAEKEEKTQLEQSYQLQVDAFLETPRVVMDEKLIVAFHILGEIQNKVHLGGKKFQGAQILPDAFPPKALPLFQKAQELISKLK
jgi:hypothetical protein